MKCFNIIFLILIVPFLSIRCKNKVNTLKVEKTVKTEKVENLLQDEANDDCITEADSVKVNNFITAIIEDMISENYDSILEKMENPAREKKTIVEMKDSFPNYLEAIFSLDIDNEEGETIGEIKDIQNAKIIYEKNDKNCLDVMIGLDSGLYFTLKKIGGNLKITKYDMAG